MRASGRVARWYFDPWIFHVIRLEYTNTHDHIHMHIHTGALSLVESDCVLSEGNGAAPAYVPIPDLVFIFTYTRTHARTHAGHAHTQLSINIYLYTHIRHLYMIRARIRAYRGQRLILHLNLGGQNCTIFFKKMVRSRSSLFVVEAMSHRFVWVTVNGINCLILVK